MMKIRAFTPKDAEELAEVYRDAVRVVGPQAYTADQVQMWASYPEDMGEFQARLSRGWTLVAEKERRLVAFGQLEPINHLAFLYCEGASCRQEIGSEIYRMLEVQSVRQGVEEIHTEATRISRPFFAKHGFAVLELEKVTRKGIEFERYKMTKKIGSKIL